MRDIKNTYEQLRKKYSLPKLEDLTKEFAIKLENPDLILHDIVNRINEKILDYAKILESVIFIGSSDEPSVLYEANMLKNKRKRIFVFYKKLMSIIWKGRRVEITANEKEMVQFIKEAYNNWIKDLKKEFIEICEIFENKWKDASLRISTEVTYHG